MNLSRVRVVSTTCVSGSQVKNLRSGVSRVAVCTLGVLYCHLQRAMDKEVETTAREGGSGRGAGPHGAALHAGTLHQRLPGRGFEPVCVCSHLSAAVRKCAAQHLADLLERVGVARLLSGGKDVTDRILPAVVKLALDSLRQLVMELYPRRPQLVEQKALPLLWGLLGPSSGSVHRATTSLCRALHHQMGPGLRQSAASQPPSVGRDLNQLLRTMS
ncbi:unnamed protein product [Arctogadus glacialis]